MITLGLVLLIIVVALLLLGLGWGAFVLLVQLGVIAQEAGKPQHSDTLDYRLNQGREIGRDDQQHSSANNGS